MSNKKVVAFLLFSCIFFSFLGEFSIFFSFLRSHKVFKKSESILSNKASLYTIAYTNRFLHTQITQRETIIKMSTITTTRSLLSTTSLRGSAVSS